MNSLILYMNKKKNLPNYLRVNIRWLLLLIFVFLLPSQTNVVYGNIFVHEDAPNPPANIVVGAYYYPWHKAHFQVSKEGYLRRLLEPRQEIRLGEYDDTQPEVIAQHLAWSKQANINVWITSWWGPNSGEDKTLRNVILPHPGLALNNHKIALLYETTGRIRKSENYDTFRLASDMEYICTTQDYMNHPNYYTIQGRPVLVVYLTRLMEKVGKLTEILTTIRSACPDVYIIGDQVWGEAPNNALDDLDAITNYDIYGNMGRPKYAGQTRVDEYFRRVADWKDHAAAHNAAFIPSVSPGYNDRGVRLASNNPGMSRRLTDQAPEGSLFAAQLAQAVQYVDPAADYFMLVNSFNEHHEDTQIEPVDGKATTLPNELTQGLEYVGYGTLYLDILYAYTSSVPPITSRSYQPIRYTGFPYGIESIHLAALYFPWFTEEHFDEGLRANLNPNQRLLPSYTSTFKEDLQLSWQSNIRIWITPWSRPSHITDTGASSIFSDPYLNKSLHQVALFYYVHARVGEDGTGGWDTSLVESDIHYLCQNYLNHPRYYKKSTAASSSKPVLFLGLSRVLHGRGSLQVVVEAIRVVAFQYYGLEIFLVGDQIWGSAPITADGPYLPFQLLDGVLNMDVYGNMGRPQGYAGEFELESYYEEQRKWRIAAWEGGCSFIPAVMPGYNDRAVRLVKDNPALSRSLSATDEEGSFFGASLDLAQHLLDDEIDNMMIINSFNHFHEDTQIYPVIGDSTNLPNDITQGLTYSGYDHMYMDMLTDRFGSFEADVLSVLPSTVPSKPPSQSPSSLPSRSPSKMPSESPSEMHSVLPSGLPSILPSLLPSGSPSKVPSVSPSGTPSKFSSGSPSLPPSKFPSFSPSVSPSKVSSLSPSASPSKVSSLPPSASPSKVSSVSPSASPSKVSSVSPSESPSVLSSVPPSGSPSKFPSIAPVPPPPAETESAFQRFFRNFFRYING